MINKELKKKDIIEDKKSSKELESDEMPLDEMDFDIVKKIISDSLLEEASVEDEEIEILEDEAFAVLEVENIQDGLKKASDILEIPIIEIKYKIIEEIDGKRKEFLKIEFRKKNIIGNTKVKISDDKLTAYLSVIYPKLPNGKRTTYHDLLDLIKRHNIKYGIKFDEIKNVLSQLKKIMMF
ncbi:flagellar assembly protein A [candidate division KSB1 bacterium]